MKNIKLRELMSGIGCGLLIGVLVQLAIFQIRGYRKHKIQKTDTTYSLLKGSTKICPESHWKHQVSESCMNCGHMDFITKHWGKDGLFCENCKSTHKGKIAKHYMYKEAISCIQCGHKNTIHKDHEYLEISCYDCKTGHYDHYRKQ